MEAILVLAQSSSEGESNPFGWILGFACIGIVIFAVVKAFKTANATDAALGKSAYETADRKTGFNYLGGHTRHVEPADGVTLVFTSTKLGVEKPLSGLLFQIPISDIESIRIETEEEMRHRITATRLLLVGIFAVAWKKRTAGSVMVSIETAGGQLLFEKPKATKPDVLKMFAKQTALLARQTQSTSPTTPAPPDPGAKSVKERLAELDHLKNEGLISEGEYAERRVQILDDL